MATGIKGNVFLLCLVGNCVNQELFMQACRAVVVVWCAGVWCCKHAINSQGLCLKKTNQGKDRASDSRCKSEIISSLSFSSLSQPLSVFPLANELSISRTMLMGVCSPTILLSAFIYFFYLVSLSFMPISHLSLRFKETGGSNSCMKYFRSVAG